MGHASWADRDLDGPQKHDDDAILRTELAPGERIVWHGRPRPWQRLLTQGVLWCIPFGVAFGGAPLAMVLLADGETFGRFPPIATLPFLLIGVLLVLSPVWYWGRTKRTQYAITDRRVLIVVAGPSGRTETRSWSGDAIRSLLRTERRDGSGDLVFEEAVGRDSNGHVEVLQRGFHAVEHVHQVEQILRATLLADRLPP